MKASFIFAVEFSIEVLNVSKLRLVILVNIPPIPSPKAVNKSIVPPKKSLITPEYSCSLPEKSSIVLIIFGRFTTAHPTRRVPTKSMILPRNPFVLLTILLEGLEAIVILLVDDASRRSSRSFFLTESLLILKNFESLEIPFFF